MDTKNRVSREVTEIIKHYPDGLDAVILLTVAREFLIRLVTGGSLEQVEINKWIDGCDLLIGPDPLNTPSE